MLHENEAMSRYVNLAFSVTALTGGAIAIGAVAIGAAAFGALAIGALAIRKLKVIDARSDNLELGSVHIRQLSVDSLNIPKR